MEQPDRQESNQHTLETTGLRGQIAALTTLAMGRSYSVGPRLRDC
jgi:hypothetical protein